MESNTFATSTYIATPPPAAFDYLRELRNLDEWTLYSRMIEQMDENTWRGTASGYQHDLYYHVRPIETPNFRGVEWHCGYEYGKYFQCYPTLLFPTDYLGSDESGVYFHSLSFVGPERRTPMIMQGIHLVHTAEIRSLKGALERKAGLTEAAQGRFEIKTSSIFVDAPTTSRRGTSATFATSANGAFPSARTARSMPARGASPTSMARTLRSNSVSTTSETIRFWSSSTATAVRTGCSGTAWSSSLAPTHSATRTLAAASSTGSPFSRKASCPGMASCKSRTTAQKA